MDKRSAIFMGGGIAAITLLGLTISGYRTISSGYPAREVMRSLSSPARPELADRHGVPLVRSEWRYSIAANSKRNRPDADRVARQLHAVVQYPDQQRVQRALQSEAPFVWIARGLNQSTAEEVLALGINGIEIRLEPGRIHAKPRLAPHVLGTVDIDGRGISGLERGLESELRKGPAPVITSLDRHLQERVGGDLEKAVRSTHALGGAALILDITTGEILALSSAPTFSIDERQDGLDRRYMNRATVGVYEARAAAHLIAAATIIENGYDSLSRFPVVAGHDQHGFVLDHGPEKELAELLISGSGQSLARAVLQLGQEALPKKTRALGLHAAQRLETRESGAPLLSRRDEIEPQPTARPPYPIASGEGIAASPLHWATAIASMVNCGRPVHPTFLKHMDERTVTSSARVFSARTANIVRELLRKEALEFPYFSVTDAVDPGVRSGIDEKVVNGRYAADRIRSSAAIVFPMRAPRYLVYVMLDEPKASPDRESRSDRSTAVRLAATIANAAFSILPNHDRMRQEMCAG